MLRQLILVLVTWITSTNAQSLLWTDGFSANTSLNSDVWSLGFGSGGNGELQEYKRSNVDKENGNLVLTVEEDKTFWDFLFGSRVFTSGLVSTQGKLEVLYGRIEVTMKVPNPANGLWPALRMIGSNANQVGQSRTGRMTIMQMGSADAIARGQAKKRVDSAVFWERNGSTASDSDSTNTQMDLTAEFHTFTLDWTPDSITTYVDSIPILSKDISATSCSECDELHEPHFLVLNVAVGGSYTGITDEADVTASFPAELLVDSVRIYDNGFTQISGTGYQAPPTEPPTTTPSASPTTTPSTSPTVTASAAPSVSPTLSPTVPPTATPTTSSTVSPTSTGAPPTSTTIQVPLQNVQTTGVIMTMTDVPPLSDSSQSKWMDATERHLVNQMVRLLDESSKVKVNITVVSQNPPFVQGTRGLRGLQKAQDEVKITFNANYAIQSTTQVQDVNPYITEAFGTNGQKAAYLEQLKDLDDAAFANVSFVSVETSATTNTEGSTDNNDNSSRIGLIVGLATAAVAVLILAVVLYNRRRRRKNRNSLRSLRECTSARKSDGKPPRELEQSVYATTAVDESVIESHATNKVAPTNVPFPTLSNRMDANASSNAPSSYRGDTDTELDSNAGFSSGLSSLDLDYNYRHSYWNADNSIVSDEQTPVSITTEEQTVCDEFTVNAPSGKLGLVLQTSLDGVPTVFEIKPTSPLKGKVQVGDRLLSVDGRDVTMVMSETVARIIASKENCEARIFVFGRPRGAK